MRIKQALTAMAIAATTCGFALAADKEAALKDKMAGYYEPVKLPDFKPAAPQIPLPIDLAKITNWQEAHKFYSDDALGFLTRNGFVVTNSFACDRVESFYNAVKEAGMPVFVTSDSLLHLYHIQFDETLRQIEEDVFYDNLVMMTKAMGRESADAWRSLPHREQKLSEKGKRELAAAELCVNYFMVARILLEEPTGMKQPLPTEVQAELDLIENHAGFAESPLFKYREDYSQYVPRGHYTRSEKLKRYFLAMTWYGRMAFLAKGKTEKMQDALISDEGARTQTLAALMIADMMQRVTPRKPPPGGIGDAKAEEVWRRIYSVTTFYVGFADDLTPDDYRTAFGKLPARELLDAAGAVEKHWGELQAEIAKLRRPEIYGGTGAQATTGEGGEADLDKALAATQGMRFMGQRFVPDSHIMGRLVFPTVGAWTGNPRSTPPFTAVKTAAGTVRGFPLGLDVVAVLGIGELGRETALPAGTALGPAERARRILKDSSDDDYKGYADELLKLQVKFMKLSEKDWNRNLYWSWLACLREMTGWVPPGYPTFMRTEAWSDKQLNAVLASWTEMRHDTILFAKPTYTPTAAEGHIPRQEKLVEGYVEPMPQLYARMLALTRMTRKGLDDMKVLDDRSRGRLKALEDILDRLGEISVMDLANKPLKKEDYDFIRSFGAHLTSVVAGASEGGMTTTLIADVHTGQNSGQVLEEGVGRLRGMAVAYPMPDGGLVVGFGPVFTYYEFKQPMADRLTDEVWKKMLQGGLGRMSRNQPPKWTNSFDGEPDNLQ